jgi:hypothetical protein
MKQRDMIRYLHMGCGEALAARRFIGEKADGSEKNNRKRIAGPGVSEQRRKTHEGQR